MAMIGPYFRRTGVLGVLVSLMIIGTKKADAQGPYPAVTDADVIALKLNHYFTADKSHHAADFEWTFTKTDFILKKGKGPIPADLLNKLLPKGAVADEIRGKWKIAAMQGQRLVLTEIKAGDMAGNADVSLPIYRTAPTVVRIGELQYVFGVGR